MKKVGWGENDAGPLDSEVVEQIEDATNYMHVSRCLRCLYAEECTGGAVIRTTIHVSLTIGLS